MEDFRSLILSFYQLGKIARSTDSKFPMVSYFANDQSVKKSLEPERGSFGNSLIALPPPSGMPKAKLGLWCDWDFREGEGSCSVQVMFAKDKDKTWGFRVDPPHARGDKHKFWHTQFTRSFKNGILFPSCSADWIDASTPSYPICLETPGRVTPVDALVYALVSIYGREIEPNLRTKLLSIGCSSSLRFIIVP